MFIKRAFNFHDTYTGYPYKNVPQIVIQKVVKIKKINMFPIKTQVKQHMVTQ